MTEHLDKIHIRDLLVRCIVGIFPHEREVPQDVYINVTMHADYRRACTSDDIADTVNYKSVKKSILSLLEDSKFYLIEKMADEVARICLKEPRIERVDITIDKPGALRFARSVAVEITRCRDDYDAQV